MKLLKDVVSFMNDGDWIESKDQSDTGIRLIQTGNIGDGVYIDKEEKKRYISEETFKTLKCTKVNCGDVLVSRLPEPVGRACIVPNIGKAITAVDCTILRFDRTQYLPKFFVYYTQSPYYQLRLQQHITGTTRKRISRKNLEQVEVPNFLVEQQQQIVNIFDELEFSITTQIKKLQILDTLIKSRFVEMFGDTMYNPNNFNIVKLCNIADIVSGITKGRKTKETEFQEVPYMAVSNVKDGYIDWTTVKTIFATKKEIEQYRLQKNDILMTEGGDPDKLGRGALLHTVPENCIHQNHIFRVRLQNKVNPIFFEIYLQSSRVKRYFLKAAKQTTGIASINMTQLKSMPTLMPPIELQNQFANFVQQVDQAKQSVNASIETLQTLKASLMQKYFH